MNKKSIFNSIKIIVLGLFLSAGISYAVTPATSNPGGFPANNPYKPVNVGPQNPTTPYQDKTGSLVTGVLQVTGNSSFLGNINILPYPTGGGGGGGGGSSSAFVPRHQSSLKEKINSFLSLVSPATKNALAAINCVPDFSTNPPSCSNSTCTSANPPYIYDPKTYTCIQPPPTAPVIDLYAATDYGQGPDVTIVPSAYAEIDWSAYGSGTVTCTASTSPSYAGDWNTTAVNTQGFYGYIPLGATSKSATRTYTLSCSNSVGTTTASAKVNVLTPPAVGGDLYVSGKVCLGTGTCSSANFATPAQTLEVNGTVKVDYLQFGAPRKLCAKSTGVWVLCP